MIELRVRHCTASRVFLLLDFVISVHSKRRACKTKNKVRMSYQWTLPCLRYVFSWIVIFTVSNVISSFTVVLQDRRERVSLESRKVVGFALLQYTLGLKNSNRSELEPFRQIRFRDGFVWTVGVRSRRNKAAFSNFVSVVCEEAL